LARLSAVTDLSHRGRHTSRSSFVDLETITLTWGSRCLLRVVRKVTYQASCGRRRRAIIRSRRSGPGRCSRTNTSLYGRSPGRLGGRRRWSLDSSLSKKRSMSSSLGTPFGSLEVRTSIHPLLKFVKYCEILMKQNHQKTLILQRFQSKRR